MNSDQNSLTTQGRRFDTQPLGSTNFQLKSPGGIKFMAGKDGTINSENDVVLDILIVGGGIIGLWTAYELARKHGSLSIAVCEKEGAFGEHTTGRNSEVLHSGIYYETGSLKHQHCMQGNRLWREFIQKNSLPFLPAGKIITSPHKESEKLQNLFEKSNKNGLEGVRWLAEQEIQEYQSHIYISSGLYIPSAGVLDVSSSLQCLRFHLQELGVMVLSSSDVKPVKNSEIDFANGHVAQVSGSLVYTKNLVNAAGLGAVSFRKDLGLFDYQDFYVKGNYLSLNRKLPFNKLIYPTPPEHGLGLGVHLTIDASGAQKFGPNTEPINQIQYQVEEGLINEMYPAIGENFKGIERADLSLGYAGIRPKVKKIVNNEAKLANDFLVQDRRQHGISGYFEFLGIESPGLTAAPSLALEMCSRIESESLSQV